MNEICPECETENPKDAKRCSKCNYPLQAQADFERLAKATAKKLKKQNPEAEEGGFFDSLIK